MKIVGIDHFPIRMKPIKVCPGTADALLEIPHLESVIIRVNTDSSVVGFGEATAIEPALNRSANGPVDRLEKYAAALIGADPLNPNEINLRLDEASSESPAGCQAAHASIEMAIYDIIGKVREVPAYTVLGGAYRTEMEVLTTLSEGSPEENAVMAKCLTDSGIRGLKVNIGSGTMLTNQNVELEKQKLLAVLESVGPEIQVDVCANQSWTTAGQVLSFFTTLLADRFYGNLSIEQPLHHLDLKGHAELRETLPISIILNESVVSPQAMMQIVHTAAADRIVINVNRVGGLTQARQIADICEAAAIGVSFGAPAGTRLGDAAHAHLASTVRDPLPVDVGSQLAFEKTPFSGGFDMIAGRVILGDEPGLGVELDEQVLSTLAIDA